MSSFRAHDIKLNFLQLLGCFSFQLFIFWAKRLVKSQAHNSTGLQQRNSKLLALNSAECSWKGEIFSNNSILNYKGFQISWVHLHQVTNKAEENVMSAENHRFTLDQTWANSWPNSSLFAPRPSSKAGASGTVKVLFLNCFIQGRAGSGAASVRNSCDFVFKGISRFLMVNF